MGRPIMHRSAISHATGEAIYCDDMPKVDGELFLALVTSSRAYAKIMYWQKRNTLFYFCVLSSVRSLFSFVCACVCVWNRGIDVSQALQIPGVVEVITAADIPGKKVRCQYNYVEELLAESEVSYHRH